MSKPSDTFVTEGRLVEVFQQVIDRIDSSKRQAEHQATTKVLTDYKKVLVQACTALVCEEHATPSIALKQVADRFLRQEIEGFTEPADKPVIEEEKS